MRKKALSDYERLDHAINELERLTCDDCVYTDIADWEEITGTGKVKPVLWCEKYNNLCSDVTDCKYKAESEEEG